METHRTSGGIPVTEELIARCAAEAEAEGLEYQVVIAGRLTGNELLCINWPGTYGQGLVFVEDINRECHPAIRAELRPTGSGSGGGA